MKIRPIAAAACLAAVVLLGTACGGKGTPGTASSNAAEQTADAKGELVAAFDKTAQQTLVSIKANIDGMTIDARIDRTAKKMHATISGTADGNAIGMEYIVSGDDMYMKYTDGALAEMMKSQMNGKEWIKTDATTMSGEDLFSLGELFDSSKMLPAGATVTKSGTAYTVENGGGKDAAGFLGGLTGTEKESADAEPETMMITVDDKGFVTAVVRKAAKPDQKDITMTYAFGETVEVTVPDPEDVLER